MTSQMTDALKSWIMVVLTLAFVFLYGAALVGWLKPLADEKMVMRLEPIIFVIIGYYFGRLPAQQNEKTLKDEIGRQTQKADAAQHAKEQAKQSSEVAEERLKNVKVALMSSTSNSSQPAGSETESKNVRPHVHPSVSTALSILNS